MAASVPAFQLNNGIKMPSVGLGCWMGSPGGAFEAEEMVKNAVRAGYRKFDTASLLVEALIQRELITYYSNRHLDMETKNTSER